MYIHASNTFSYFYLVFEGNIYFLLPDSRKNHQDINGQAEWKKYFNQYAL